MPWARKGISFLMVALATASGGANPPASVAEAVEPASSCKPVWRRVPTPNATSWVNWLNGVYALTPSDVWAVGYSYDDITYEEHTLTEHWDGSVWTIVPSPNSVEGNGNLRAVTAISATDVWAVGSSYSPAGVGQRRTLIEHWDGVVWTTIQSPRPGTGSELTGVWGASASDVWAVGQYTSETVRPLVLHWDGSTWSSVSVPNPTDYDVLRNVSGVSSSDVWAVGQSDAGPLALHWDGEVWTQVEVPDPGYYAGGLFDVATISSTDVWAVGWAESQDISKFWSKWHWDGTLWHTSPDDPAYIGVFPKGVAGASAGHVWSVGEFGLNYPIFDHWDGAEWTRLDQPFLSASWTEDVAVDGRRVWAVGAVQQEGGRFDTFVGRLCAVSVSESGFTPDRSSILMDELVFWSVGPDVVEPHSISDGSGMGLFESGSLGAGGSFSFRFEAASAYPVVDIDANQRSFVLVPPTVSPKHGDPSTTFRITWATSFAEQGFVYDVQVKRPASDRYENWRMGTTADSAEFVPDAGPGVYSFRARLRQPQTEEAADWSPPRSIVVE